MKALFFSPYADVWVFSLPEAEIADALRDDGWEIHRIICNRDFSNHCVAMAAKGLDFTAEESSKNAVCTSCIHRQSLIRKSFGFHDIAISSLIGIEDQLKI